MIHWVLTRLGVGRSSKVSSRWRDVYQVDPDSAEAYAEAYLRQASSYSYRGEYQTAVADYDKAIQLAPNFAKAYHNRGAAYHNLGQDAKADADNAKACSLNSQYC